MGFLTNALPAAWKVVVDFLSVDDGQKTSSGLCGWSQSLRGRFLGGFGVTNRSAEVSRSMSASPGWPESFGVVNS